MPNINRIRVINFSYNNDARHILDETFNLHGGENALLNLANGGGKSVLVQLMLQPVVPRARIQGRQIADFFRKKKTPAYALIEWKLDGAGGYLLTGIGIAAQETRTGDEDEKGRIRLFCFLSQYSHASAFDLANIDLVRHEEGIVHITGYKAAQDMMKEATRRDPLHLSYFPQDDLAAHRKKLMEYGISQDEWQNVMLRVNDSEGGLEEIFSKCKTSDQLLNVWLIKTIEQTMAPNAGDEGADEKNLQRMFQNLLQETLENEGLLLEKQQLSVFLPAFESLKEQASSLAVQLDDMRTSEAVLASLREWLAVQAEVTERERTENESDQRLLGQQLLHLQQEEYSEAVHLAKATWITEKDAKEKVMADKTEVTAKADQVAALLHLLGAAKIRVQMDVLQAKIAVLQRKMQEVEADESVTLRIHLLKASLRSAWDLRLQDRVALHQKAAATVSEIRELQGQLKAQGTKIVQELQRLTAEHEGLNKQVAVFEERERQACDTLVIILSRNMAGELSAPETARLSAQWVKARDMADESLIKMEKEETALTLEQSRLSDDLRSAEKQQMAQAAQVQAIEAALEQWRQKMAERSRILQDNGLDGSENKETAVLHFKEKIHDLYRRIGLDEQERQQQQTLLEDLRHGRYHVQGEWTQYLTEMNMAHQTGEDYLRRRDPAEREALLAEMPFLPYALLLSSAHLAALPAMSGQLVRRGLTPLMTYEGLKSWHGIADTEKTFETASLEKPWQGRSFTALEDRLLFTALYNPDALQADASQRLMTAAEEQCALLQASVDNLREEQTRVTNNLQTISSFPWAEGWKEIQEAELLRLVKSMDLTAEKLQVLHSTLQQKQKQYNNLIRQNLPEARKQCINAVQKIETWEKLLSGNELYVENRCKQADSTVLLKRLQAEQQQVRLQTEEQSERLLEKDNERVSYANQEQVARIARDTYQDNVLEAGESVLSGTCEMLEATLKELQEEQGQGIRELERRTKELQSDLAERQKEVDKKHIASDAFWPAYDEVEENLLENEQAGLQKQVKMIETTLLAAAGKEARSVANLEHAGKRLNESGLSEPLAEQEIHGRYRERKKETDSRLAELRSRQKQLESLGREMAAGGQRLSDALGKSHPDKTASGFVVPENWQDTLDEGLEKLKEARESVTRRKGEFQRLYTKARHTYAGKSSLLKNLFDGLEGMLDRSTEAYEPFYYLFERMQDHANLLAKQISMLNTKLEGLDRSRADVVEHCTMHGSRLVEELKRIEQKSIVRLEGRATATGMVRVDMKPDTPQEARARMESHVEKSIRTIQEEVQSGKNEREVKSAIERLIQSRELLNQYLGTSHIPIYVYKIDLNMGNSRFKVWEDAVRENSGGEKFVVYFSVLTALMAYTRASEQAVQLAEGLDVAKETSRVLIMDNPFGPISSEHLLKPLFEIAKRYHTQLICLTDLKQSSILNNFNLVYMLRIRKGLASSDEYLKVEAFKRAEGVATADEALEKAFYKVTDFQQMQLG